MRSETPSPMRLPFALLTLFLLWGGANAQQPQPALVESELTAGVKVKTSAETPLKDGAPSEIEQLRTQVEQLRVLVEQQQKQLSDLEKRFGDGQGKSGPPNDVARSQPAGESRTVLAGEGTLSGASAAAAPAGESLEQKPPAQKTTPILAGWDGNHAFLRSADGSFETLLTGYAQLDFRGYQAGNHPANTFLIRRARASIEGKLFRYFEYRVQGDLADNVGTLLRDAYLRVHRDDRFQLTFGQFKEPFSQEELRADQDADFVEKSLANNLAPSRSPGIMLSGVFRKGEFEYQLGVFNGKGLLASNLVGTPEGAARIRFAPWKNSKDFWTSGLSFGGAYAVGRNNTTALGIRGLTESRSFIYFTADTVNGSMTRANGELTWTVGPAAFRAEYDQTNQARNRLGLNGRDLPGVVAKGFAGQFTYVLTGESKSESGAVTPKHNLFGDESGKPGLGAWELKLRYSGLQLADGTAKSNRAQTIYFGANWYLNRFVRYMLDFGFEHYGDPLRTPRPGERNFRVVLSRVQLAF